MAQGARVIAPSEAEGLEKAKALFRDCPRDTFKLRQQNAEREPRRADPKQEDAR